MKRLLIPLVLLGVFAAVAQAQTLIRVPQDQPTVQAGINAAVNGDTVLVAEGTYVENLKINKKIVLGSLFIIDGDTSHISKTVLDGSSPSHPDSGSVVLFDTGSDSTSVLAGFTLTKGTGSRVLEQPSAIYWRFGGGIAVMDGGATIRKNHITHNSLTHSYSFGGGIANWSMAANVVVEANTIDSNYVSGTAFAEGGGMSLGCKVYAANNIIARNTISRGIGGAVSLWGNITTQFVLVNNTIVHNKAIAGIEGIGAYGGGKLRMMNNIIWNPGDGVDCNIFFSITEINARNNLVRGNTLGENNLNLDPEFADTLNFTLLPTSPGISAGRDTATLGGILVSSPSTDRYGSPRGGGLPDLGAVESSTQTATPARQAPQFTYHMMPFGGFQREYYLFRPSNYASLSSLPLLISLHGCGETTRGQTVFGFSDIADSMGFLVVYPQALGSCWQDGVTGRTLQYDIQFVDALIDTLIAKFKVDVTRIYATGFSSGGIFSYRLASQSGYNLAGIAPFAASIPTGITLSAPRRPVPMIYFHGTADPNVPFGGGANFLSAAQTLAQWATYNFADTVTVTDLPDVNVSDQSTVQKVVLQGVAGPPRSASIHFYRVEGGGHIIPGPQVWWNGPVNRDVNGPLEIMKFFQNSSQVTYANEQVGQIPETFALSQNYPNPFNPATAISYQLSAFSKVSLKVFDILGREVATLVSGEQPAGVYRAEWNAAVSSGVYFYRLEAVGKDGASTPSKNTGQAGSAHSFVETKKMLLLR